MGGCLSKKSTNSSSPGPVQNPPEKIKSNVQLEKKKVEEEPVRKEIFIIKHRKSQDIERRGNIEEIVDAEKVTEVAEPCIPADCNNASKGSANLFAAPVRTSSCTKEEVDAILIQCGRLSRSSSTGKAAGVSASNGSGDNNGNVQRGRKYSGSKRSYDFETENNGNEITDKEGRKGDCFEENIEKGDDNAVGEASDRHRQRQRQSRTVGSPSKGRRRTPSREREQGQRQQSGNRENSSNGGGGRRVSRSPGRRSESPVNTSSNGSNSSAANATNSNNGARPGKMVSVPATVSSLAMDRSNNAERHETVSGSAIKRIQVKRNAGSEAAAAVVVGSRTVASPRARSPARANSPARTNAKISNDNNGSSNQNQQQPVSLSRSNSRKADVSPFRRNPLGEIDNNVPVEQIHAQVLKASGNIMHQAPSQKLNADSKTCIITKGTVEKNAKHSNAEEAKGPQTFSNNVAVNVVASSGTESFKPHGLTRTRSSRLSRDLDIDPEALSNPPAPTSYTSLLLEDIQNFHQKSTNNNPPPSFTLPACVSKARSICEAVADLNSSTKTRPTEFNRSYENGTAGKKKKGLEIEDRFMQSEVVANDDDDLMKPSLHRYVTVQRGSLGEEEDIEQQESSGSNSFVGSQQHWVSSSSWEPDSADSTGRCYTTSSRSNSREDDRCPLGSSQRQVISDSGHDSEEALRRSSGKRRESGIGRNRLPTAAST